MRLIHLPPFWTVVVDCIAWFIIHMGVVSITIRIPANRFHPNSWVFISRDWERQGNLYQEIFKIKKWKKHLLDGAAFAGKLGFPKKKLRGRSETYLGAFLIETCRAELTHWLILFFAPFFFLWNPFGVGLFMIFYAAVENLPLILAQRYNRYRLRRVLMKEGSNF
jgi:glycosyl-4,4'-diaponeurosporenoate acyltransferase